LSTSNSKATTIQIYNNEAVSIGEAAKLLNLGIGQNTIFKLLREKKILNKDNHPYEEYIRGGYFKIIQENFKIKGGQRKIYSKTLVCKKGLAFIKKIYDKV
jgi:anti-repressor protein